MEQKTREVGALRTHIRHLKHAAATTTCPRQSTCCGKCCGRLK